MEILANWSLKQVETIYLSLRQLEKGIQSIIGSSGTEWIKKNLGGTTFNSTVFSTSFVTGSTVWLAPNYENDALWGNSINQTAIGMLIHELGHVWDNKSKENSSILGGGHSDALYQFMGGTPGQPSLYRAGGGVNPPELRYPDTGGLRYGNNSSADYFSHTFVGTVLSISGVPPKAHMWMAAVIDLSK